MLYNRLVLGYKYKAGVSGFIDLFPYHLMRDPSLETFKSTPTRIATAIHYCLNHGIGGIFALQFEYSDGTKSQLYGDETSTYPECWETLGISPTTTHISLATDANEFFRL